MRIIEADKNLDFEDLNVPVIRIGKFWLTYCAHGGLWLANDLSEGMQIQGPKLKEFESVIAEFWKKEF